jgi:hypothetical protein
MFPHLSAPFRTFSAPTPHLENRARSAPPHPSLMGCGGAVRKEVSAADLFFGSAPHRTKEDFEMAELGYLVIEYWPQSMHHEKLIPARIDGHYHKLADAQDVAALWAENPNGINSRIVVVEVQAETQRPSYWPEAAA